MKKIICILMAGLMLACAAACGAVQDSSAASEPEAQTADTQKIIFESRFDESGEYTDNCGNTVQYSFSLPRIVCDTDYAKCVNGEIYDLFEKMILPALVSMSDGTSLITVRSDWQNSEYNGITSLCLFFKSDFDSEYTYIWNFDADGNEADNAAVLKAAGMTPEEFEAKAKEILEKEVAFDRDGMSEEIIKAREEDAEKTLSKENLNSEIPIAVADDGGIVFCAKVYSVAGSGYYFRNYHILPSGGYEEIRN